MQRVSYVERVADNVASSLPRRTLTSRCAPPGGGASSAQQDEEVAIAGAAAIQNAESAGDPKADVTHVPAATVVKSFSESVSVATTTGPQS